MVEFSGLAKVKEFLNLKYPRHVVKAALLAIWRGIYGRARGRTWRLNVRDIKIYSTTVQRPVARYTLCYELGMADREVNTGNGLLPGYHKG